jgi:hypothetical protein
MARSLRVAVLGSDEAACMQLLGAWFNEYG